MKETKPYNSEFINWITTIVALTYFPIMLGITLFVECKTESSILTATMVVVTEIGQCLLLYLLVKWSKRPL